MRMVWFDESFTYTYPNSTHVLCLRYVCQHQAHFLGRKLNFFSVFHFAAQGRNKSVSVHKKPFGAGRKQRCLSTVANTKSSKKEVVK